MTKKRDHDLKEDNDLRRWLFARNLHGLTSKVLGLNRIDAAANLGVDYGWLRKACSVGLVRSESRNIEVLSKIADRFLLSVEELWMPNLLEQIWAGGYRPELRAYFIERFHFDKYVTSSKEFQADVEEAKECGLLGPQSSYPQFSFSNSGSATPAPALDEAGRESLMQLGALLETGRYEYLRRLIRDLFAAEQTAREAIEKRRVENVPEAL